MTEGIIVIHSSVNVREVKLNGNIQSNFLK